MQWAKFFIACSVLIYCTKGNVIAVDDEINCANYGGPVPHITPLNLIVKGGTYVQPEDPRSTSIEKVHTESTWFKNFECSYHKPIQWVFNLDPIKKMSVEVDFAERIVASDGKTSEEPRYTYAAMFRLSLRRMKDIWDGMLLSCEPIPLENPCERNFIEAYGINGWNDNPTRAPHVSLLNVSTALWKSSTENTRTKFYDEARCPLKLILKINAGNEIMYKWITKEGETGTISESRVLLTNETLYFRNTYRFSKSLERNCVRILNTTEPCVNCRNANRVMNSTVNAAIFQATQANTTLVYKGMFSVPENSIDERRFYFDWQVSESKIEKRMMKLFVPEKVYANITFTARCKVSIFFFSYGTKITEKAAPEYMESNATIREWFQPYGFREVVRNMTFSNGNDMQTISCFGPLKTSERWMRRTEARYVEYAIPPYINNLFHNESVYQTLYEGQEHVVIECIATGNPMPTLEWKIPDKLSIDDQNKKLNITSSPNFLRIVFPKWEAKFAGTYLCQAQNTFGFTTRVFNLRQVEGSSQFVPIIASTLGALLFLLGMAIGILGWKIRKQRREFEIQTQKAIEEFKNGVKKEDVAEAEQDLNFSILQQPYNEAFEVPQREWIIEDKILGSGQFGIVRLGSVVLRGQQVKVAVKSLKSSIEIDEFKSFLFELKIMAYLGQHKNIVSLIASCTEGIHNRDIVIAVEFCDNGSLLEFLRKYRGSFRNMIAPDGKITSNLSSMDSDQNTTEYANVSVMSTHQLYRWAYHIACGMDYLRVKKVLHGDLAARNVLLTQRQVAKIGDFGLSRVLMNSENYRKQSQTALPWKWMAPESLSERVFSVNSDIWAYGICLHEIFTLGQSPYPGIGWSPDFITQLNNGMRMEKPPYCTTSIYKIMRATWEFQPHERPNYAKIKRKLAKGLVRLSTLIKAQDEPRQQRSSLSEDSKKSSIISSGKLHAPETVNEEEDIIYTEDESDAVYTNLTGRTMNYYKNC